MHTVGTEQTTAQGTKVRQGGIGVEGIREGVGGDLHAQALKNSRLRKAGVRKWMLHADE